MTIVAACMRAETGVGPAIASGSHSWRGNWADFPMGPKSSMTEVSVSRPGNDLTISPIHSGAVCVRVTKLKVLAYEYIMSMAPSIMASPRLVTTNAFMPQWEGG